MPVLEAIREAEALLPGVPAPDGQTDPRWQRIIAVGEYIQTDPDAVWDFIARWGRHKDPDLRKAVSTCLLEHLLEHHFEAIFPRVENLATADPLFGETFCGCWVDTETPEQHARLNALAQKLGCVISTLNCNTERHGP